MAKQTYVYSGTEWVPLASEVTNLTAYQTRALAQASNRNLIINGAMQVAQRGTSTASITSDTYGAADRWRLLPNTQGTWTMSQESDAPTGSGFRNSTKVLCTTADASPAAGDYIRLDQRIEGQNLQQLKKGTAAAEQLTLSFWVKANVTGTYIVRLYDNDNAREVSKSYTINASGTWEYETITFPADTTGAFDNDNNASLIVMFMLGAGSNYTSGTLQTTWAASTLANSAVGQVNLASATNNYWQITGVQLEVGDTATPFEFKSFGEDLNECERYYQKSYPYAIAPGAAGVNYVGSVSGIARDSAAIVAHAGRFVQTMRAFPTVTIYHQDGTVNAVYEINTGTKKTGASANHIGDKGYWEVGASALTSGQNYYWHHTASAEL